MLFHYTSKEAFFSIIKSQTMWAFRFDQMNDPTEIHLINKFIRSFLIDKFDSDFKNFPNEKKKGFKKAIKKSGEEKYSIYMAEKLIESFSRVIFLGTDRIPAALTPFIISFCRHSDEYEIDNGMLSQWRAYGKSGYCIVFDDDEMRYSVNQEISKFSYGFYENISNVYYIHKEGGFRQRYDKFLDMAYTAASSIKENAEENFCQFFPHYAREACLLKHYGFREENESRIILSPITRDRLEFIERDGGSLKANFKDIKNHPKLDRQYVEFIGNGKLPIKRVIVGPGVDQDERYQKALAALPSDIVVTKSETPFIDRNA